MIDATFTDLGQGLAWESVYRTRPRIGLTCPECGHGVVDPQLGQRLAAVGAGVGGLGADVAEVSRPNSGPC